ncbi:MAG: YccF domain-containing protein, partial [Bilophila sp.]|nr:YccF domain-containing protein [Bilophila sp.]
MRLLGNILWHFPCFGFLMSLFSFIVGAILTVTVVGAPIGLGLIQYSKFALA